jgi:hypothetical protein
MCSVNAVGNLEAVPRVKMYNLCAVPAGANIQCLQYFGVSPDYVFTFHLGTAQP